MHDRLRKALNDRSLTNTRLTNQNRIILRAARQDLHDALHLDAATDDRIQLVLARSLRQVATELLEDRGVRALRTTAAPHARANRLAALLVTPLVAAEHLDDRLTHLRQIRALLSQHLGGHTLTLLQEAEQQMLRPNVVVAQLKGLTQTQLENALRARRERNMALNRLLTLANNLNDRSAHGLTLDAHRLQSLRRDALALRDQAEQQVLRANVIVLKTAGLILREHDDPARAISKAFEHVSPCFGASAAARRTPVPVDWLQPTESSGAVRALSPSAQGGAGAGRGRRARGRGAGAGARGARGRGRPGAREH